MKNLRSGVFVFILGLSINSINAQIPSLDFLYGPSNDANLILTEYVRPYANILGANLNAGWYNTAKPHKPLGFDITASVSVAFAPPDALSYDLNSLTGLNADIEGTTIAPTVAGRQESRPVLVYNEQFTNPVSNLPEDYELARITHPDGSGIDFLPLPMGQLTLGLIKGTDVSLRWIPTVNFGDYGSLGLFGIGGRHSVSQWIPVVKTLKFLNIAVQGGFTKVDASAHMNLQPKVEVEIANPPAWDDQFLNLNLRGWTVNLIASQSIPLITVYEGIGYSNSAMDLALLGHYPVNSIVTETGADFGKTTYTVATDPVEGLNYENNNNLRLNAGIRLKLGILTIHYDYTKTLYATHTAGIGITFR